MMIVEVVYMAIKMDNYQGGCGMPFKSSFFMTFNENEKLGNIYNKIEESIKLKEMLKSDFIKERNIIKIIIHKEVKND